MMKQCVQFWYLAIERQKNHIAECELWQAYNFDLFFFYFPVPSNDVSFFAS